MASALISRTTRFQGLKLTLRLESEFWTALQEIAETKGVSLGELIASVNVDAASNRTSAVRVLALMNYWRPTNTTTRPPGSGGVGSTWPSRCHRSR